MRSGGLGQYVGSGELGVGSGELGQYVGSGELGQYVE